MRYFTANPQRRLIIRAMLVNNFLEESARHLPDKVALICEQERLTYGEIDRRAEALASYLKRLGLERQDRVAILLENSVESVIALFAVLKADAVFLMLSATMKSEKLCYILNDCGVKVLITHQKKAEKVHAAVFQAPALTDVIWVANDLSAIRTGNSSVRHHLLGHAWSSDSNALPVVPSDGDTPPTSDHPIPHCNIDLDLASIIYTSGSGGDPKGVMLTHQNIVTASASIITYLENREDDIIMNVLPLSFDYGLYQVLMAFRFGGTVLLEKSFAYPYRILQDMLRERVTGFPGVPTLFAILLGLKEAGSLDLPDLRYITSTAAVLPVDHIQRLRELFPHVQVYSMYGLTECKRVSYLPPAELDDRPASVGRGMPNEEVWIVDETGTRLGPREVGELVVRGSHVMRGYWGLPEETAQALRPGKYPGEVVLYTGDLFKTDEKGYLYFVGRRDDMIKSRGERISPQEVERCLCALDGVMEAAVIGVEDSILGQAVIAYVRRSEGNRLDYKSILKHCRDHLEDCMVPKAIRFVTSFKRTDNGKIDRLYLKTLETAA
jgi:long-chain acyl-CoA synthetase